LEYGNEEDQKLQHLYMFASMLEKELNYFNMNSSTAFGNPDFSFYQGQVRGWLAAKQWECEERKKDSLLKLIDYDYTSSCLNIIISQKDLISKAFDKAEVFYMD
jgi:hypothetical protein